MKLTKILDKEFKVKLINLKNKLNDKKYSECIAIVMNIKYSNNSKYSKDISIIKELFDKKNYEKLLEKIELILKGIK